MRNFVKDFAWLELFGVDIEHFHSSFDVTERIVTIENTEVLGNTKSVAVIPEYVNRQAMKRANKWLAGAMKRCRRGVLSLFVQESGDAIAHFFGGFVGKGDGENLLGRYAVGDEIHDPVSNSFGFTRAGTSDDEEWTLSVCRRFLLFGVE